MEWTIDSAQANLERVVDLAITEGPQYVRDGEQNVVLISIAEFQRIAQDEPSLTDFLLAGPDLSDLDVTRDHSPMSDVELE